MHENRLKKCKSRVISNKSKNRSRKATYLIFVPVKAESPYFSMKMRFLVSETIGALYFSLKRIYFLKKIENSEKSVFRA